MSPSTMTIPIKTLPDLINYYERRMEKISEHYEQRALWGHATWDSHEISMIKEFLNFLYGLDRDVEIVRMKQKSDLAWQRVMKYIRLASHEAEKHCPKEEDPELDAELNEELEEGDEL